MTASHYSDPHFGVKEILEICLSHWKVFLVLSFGFLSVGLLFFLTKVPFIATASMVFNDSQNSSLQAFSSQFYGMSKAVQETRKGSSLLYKHIEFLKNRQFFETLLIEISNRGNSNLITMDERRGFENFKQEYMQNLAQESKRTDLLLKLDKWIKISIESEFQIKVAVTSPDRSVSLFLANTVIELASSELKKRELDEINQVRNFIFEQKNLTDQGLQLIGRKIASSEGLGDTVATYASKEKMIDYISELVVRSTELSLKISENKILIEQLENAKASTGESLLYGTVGRIEILKSENELLNNKLNQVSLVILKMKNALKDITFQKELFEDLKKKSEIEYSRYRELSTALEKIEATKLSIDTRFELLEKARIETVLPQFGLGVIGMVALLTAQLGAFLFIYARFLLNPSSLLFNQAGGNLFDGGLVSNSVFRDSNLSSESKCELTQI